MVTHGGTRGRGSADPTASAGTGPTAGREERRIAKYSGTEWRHEARQGRSPVDHGEDEPGEDGRQRNRIARPASAHGRVNDSIERKTAADERQTFVRRSAGLRQMAWDCHGIRATEARTNTTAK